MSQHRIAFGALVGGAFGFWVAEQFAEYYRVRARSHLRKRKSVLPTPLEKAPTAECRSTALVPPRSSKSVTLRTATCASKRSVRALRRRRSRSRPRRNERAAARRSR